VAAPLQGTAVSLKEVNDSTFSEEILGKGAAIIPESGKVVSPVNGVISTLFDSKHAIAITSDDGAEILIHVGLDTVKLEGKYFTPHIKTGDVVKVGQLLLEFDKDKIVEQGYDIITPVIITNFSEYTDIVPITGKKINLSEQFLKLIK
jgi:PTS system beta-glucosides-specific IIC component